MLLHDARRAGRETAGGDIVPAGGAGTARCWDQRRSPRGLRWCKRALSEPGRPEPYAVQAADRGTSMRRPPNYKDNRPGRRSRAHL